jgi:hypothetical protein
MHSHSQLNLRISLQGLADFHRAFHRRFRAVGKHQRHSITGREPDQFASRFGFAEMRCVPDELIKLLKYLALIVDQEFRKANHIHEQDMGDFEMKILFNRCRHPVKLPENKVFDNSASSRPSRTKLAQLGLEAELC